MTSHRLERVGQPVIDHLVIARGNPDLAVDLNAYLGGAGDVAGGVKRYLRPADLPLLAICDAVSGDVAQTVAHDGQGDVGGKVTVHAPAGVIGMPVGDQGTVHRPPRVDIEITRGAINAVFVERQNRLLGHAHKLAGRARLNRVGEKILAYAEYDVEISVG